MTDLVIQENNSLFSRPLMYKDGIVLEQNVIVPDNMDRMYLKVESQNDAIVSIHTDNDTKVLP